MSGMTLLIAAALVTAVWLLRPRKRTYTLTYVIWYAGAEKLHTVTPVTCWSDELAKNIRSHAPPGDLVWSSPDDTNHVRIDVFVRDDELPEAMRRP